MIGAAAVSGLKGGHGASKTDEGFRLQGQRGEGAEGESKVLRAREEGRH
jgi:hypothetical protein